MDKRFHRITLFRSFHSSRKGFNTFNGINTFPRHDCEFLKRVFHFSYLNQSTKTSTKPVSLPRKKKTGVKTPKTSIFLIYISLGFSLRVFLWFLAPGGGFLRWGPPRLKEVVALALVMPCHLSYDINPSLHVVVLQNYTGRKGCLLLVVPRGG